MLPTEQQPVRCNINHCEKTNVDTFIMALKNDFRFKLKSVLSTTDKCHFERFNFLFGKNKVSVVYDTKANILSLTAVNEIFDVLKSICLDHGISIVQTAKPVQNSALQQSTIPSQNLSVYQKTNVLPVPKAEPSAQIAVVVQTLPVEQNSTAFHTTDVAPIAVQGKQPIQVPILQNKSEQQKPPIAAAALAVPKKKPKKPTKSIANCSTAAEHKQTNEVTSFVKSSESNSLQNSMQNFGSIALQNLPQNQSGDPLLEYKNGFSIKKCLPERLEGILKRIRLLEGVTLKAEPTAFADTLQEIKSYEIADTNKQKVKLRYTTKKQSLQLQGKRCNLFGEVQVILSRDSTYLSAVNSHIELTGEEKRAGEIQRQLKKLLADAFGFLSEQSKIDLSIGMIDINNAEVRLSDYSVLLVPPYRGLERLIFDLQSAQGITVKMIGQAYEKDDEGHYLLKSGYRKKIGSIVYSEVMSALYTEYFSQRNFYAHSDNSFESQVRRIEDKQTAKIIFDNLCKVINYNCKKLKEIGFDAKEV